MDEMERLQAIFDESENIVFFGGAGVSTESGVPDFRSPDGLYAQKYPYPPETMLSHSFFVRHPGQFFAFYREKILCHNAAPNAAHLKVAELERAGRLSAVITQNIDGLHTAAGSRNVVELHGSIHRNFCQSCGAGYTADYMRAAADVPLCSACGGRVKPDVVLYEEPLNQRALQRAVRYISAADMLIVGGTSLTVWPAAGLVDYFSGKNLVIINRQPTPQDAKATLLVAGPIAATLQQVAVRARPPGGKTPGG